MNRQRQTSGAALPDDQFNDAADLNAVICDAAELSLQEYIEQRRKTAKDYKLAAFELDEMVNEKRGNSNVAPFVVKKTKTEDWPHPVWDTIDPNYNTPEFPVEVFSPAPFDVENLRGAAACIKREAQRRSAPVDYVAATLLSTAAGLIGNSRRVIKNSGWREPCAINCALIGKPSYRKSPAMDSILVHLRPIEREIAIEHQATLRDYELQLLESKRARDAWESEVRDREDVNAPGPEMPEGAETPIKPRCPHIKVMDSTVAELQNVCCASIKGVLHVRDELSGWLEKLSAKNSDGDRAFFLETFGGRPYAVDRVKNDGQRVIIPHLLISILGSTQPAKLSKAFVDSADDGLCSRFFFFWPQPTPYEPCDDFDESLEIEHALKRLHSLELRPAGEEQDLAPVDLPLTASAKKLFDQWCKEITERGNAAEGLMSGFLGKATGGVLRLALVFQHLDWAFYDEPKPPPSEITHQAIKRGILFYDEYAIAHAEKAFGDASRPEDELLAARFAKEILKRKETCIKARDVYKNWKMKKPLNRADAVKRAGRVLEEMDWLEDVSVRAGGTQGRQALMWDVNPRVFERPQP